VGAQPICNYAMPTGWPLAITAAVRSAQVLAAVSTAEDKAAIGISPASLSPSWMHPQAAQARANAGPATASGVGAGGAQAIAQPGGGVL
jgi:hypothetical protein